MPKISIITTTYCHEWFIAHTIDSVLSQSYADWELLIGDDSPDDATWDTIQLYVEKYPDKIRAWHHSPNKGIVGNMDFLITQISPSVKYLSFLEGDDMYSPGNLTQKVRVFEDQKDIAIVCSDYIFVDENNIRTGWGYCGIFPLENGKKYVSSREITGVPFSWSTSACRKEVFFAWQKSRFLPHTGSWYSVSDYDFYFQSILAGCRFYIIDSLLVEYRWHSGNLSITSGKISEDLSQLYDFYRSVHLISKQEYDKFMVMNTYLMAGMYSILGKKILSLKVLYSRRRFLRMSYIVSYLRICIMFFIPSKILTPLYQKRISKK